MPPRCGRSSLRIEAYFQQVREAIESCPLVQSSNVTYDKRSSSSGFIRGEIYLVDDSVLHLREFLDVEVDIERLTYVYQYGRRSAVGFSIRQYRTSQAAEPAYLASSQARGC